ncbi:MAG: AMP-binding protein [Rhodospirillales bacterium]|jgi:acyl-CoA synthetase (AMP-forming)/AMP-acid ligase II/acyl carrier protein|nr:AMP-binding protein [Rhodospirillales bacterium]MDP6805466.1 AMP-binding protein [Rhodospirillales bacterium]
MAIDRTPEAIAHPRSGGDVAEAPDSLAPQLLGVIKTVAEELHPRRAELRAANLDSALDRDLGFDSLGRVELIVRVERAFDVALPERVFSTAETPRELLAAVRAAAGASGVQVSKELGAVAVGEAAEIPHGAQTLVEVIDWHAAAHPDRPHIRFYDDHDEGEAITYGRLHALAQEVAVGLERLELGRGEAVVIMLPTGAEYFASFLGVLVAGGVPVPVYPPGRPTQVEEHVRRHAAICHNCRARIMITTPEAQRFTNLLRTLVDGLGAVVSFDELTAGPATRAMRPPVAAADVALFQYTSGSTGDPKGVVLTHANLLANIRAMAEALDAGPDGVFVSWLPLYHDMGLIGAWLGSMHHAIPLVIMSPLSFFTRPQRWLWAIHRYRGTLSGAPNFAFDLCTRRIADKDIEGLDLGSWRVAFNGAEPVSPDTLERFSTRFAGHGFARTAMMPVYGLAECSVGVAFSPLGRGPRIDRVTRPAFTATGFAEPAHEADSGALSFVECGHPLPRHEIRIVDAQGRELPDRQQGRLQFRGPSATSGYLHDPERTRALFGDGWLESGDLAYVSGGGIFVTGRGKDVVIKAGRNIYPVELEEAIGDVAGVRKGNVAVFGSPDPSSGVERLIVVAETRERDETVRADLVTRINAIATDRLDAPPDHVVLAPPNSVLRTSSGKVRRDANAL